MKLHPERILRTATDYLWHLNAFNTPSIEAMQEQLTARPLRAKFGDYVERVMNVRRQ